MRAAQWTTLGLWLATEWAFLWALDRIGHFVKRPRLALFCGVTAVAAALVVGLWVALSFSSGTHLLPLLEIGLAGLFALYLYLLATARNAVLSKTPDEAIAPESESSL